MPIDAVQGGTASESGLFCLSLLLKHNQIAAEPAQLRHELGKGDELTADDLVRLAKRLGAKAKRTEARPETLSRVSLPAIAIGQDGGFFIIAQATEETVLLQDPSKGRPEKLSMEQLAGRWTGELVLLTSRARLTGDERKFDVSWFIPALVKYRHLLRDVFIASFFLQLFGLVTPLFFQVVIDKVLVHKGLTTLDVMVIGLVIVSLFEVIMGGLRSYLFSHTTNRVDVELGGKLYRHLLRLPMAYFASRPVGHSVARVRELENIRNFLTSSSLTLVLDLFFTIVFFAVMYLYSPMLTLIVLLSLPVYIAISAFITPSLRSRLDEKFQRGAENQAFLVESVTGVETLKAMSVEPQMQQKWEKLLSGYVTSSFKANMLGTLGSQLVQGTNKITTALTLFFGAKLAIAGEITVGQLVAFNMLASRVSMPILRLAQLWQDFQQMRISVARLGDVLNTPGEPAHDPGRATLPAIKGQITFDRVTFRYRSDGPEVLRDVSLEIRRGEILGIVGPSGSGKSTLGKLIQRLHVPESGRVLVDGVDLALVDPAWLRRQVGVVLQENILFKRSVRENIALADPMMAMARITAAAELAGAHEFILQLPEGYDTEIDERGGNLSGGQRQRVAIARALLTDPRILVFDEATSALDAESEEVIHANMAQMAEGRTLVIIAHRLSSLRHCTRIVAMDKGRIVEEGSHAALLEQNGLYARLWTRQMGRQAAE